MMTRSQDQKLSLLERDKQEVSEMRGIEYDK